MIRKELNLHAEIKKSSLIFADSTAELNEILPKKRIILLTDSNLAQLYPDFIAHFQTIITKPGENNKNLHSITNILEELQQFGADRDSFLLCFGGGVAGDMGGFAASIYMRGISFGFIPTSLLAMVDASVGGKNGVNLNSWKNMVGSFTQPEFVFIHPSYLQTLPEREFISGMAEVVKHAVLSSDQYLEFLEEHREEILRRDLPVLLRMIQESILFKASVVEADEKETGKRRILNFGHTLGHAIEKEQKYNHGESVSLGMVLALKISERHHFLSSEITQRIMRLLEYFHLPTSQFPDNHILIRNSKGDKKKSGEQIHFVFLKTIGNPVVDKIDFRALEKSLHEIVQQG